MDILHGKDGLVVHAKWFKHKQAYTPYNSVLNTCTSHSCTRHSWAAMKNIAETHKPLNMNTMHTIFKVIGWAHAFLARGQPWTYCGSAMTFEMI